MTDDISLSKSNKNSESSSSSCSPVSASREDKELLFRRKLMEEQVRHYALHSLEASVAQEYQQALQQAPELVQREICLHNFLTTDKMHVARAARRLALYWKTRKEIFGSGRWLLPMTQTGTGALSPEHVQLLRTGVHAPFIRIEKEEDDCDDRSSSEMVMIADVSRLPKEALPNLQRQQAFPALLFYFGTIYCRALPKTTFLHVVQDLTAAKMHGPAVTDEMALRIVQCMPAREAFRAVVAQKFDPANNDRLAVIALGQKTRAEKHFKRAANYVMGNSIRETVNGLEELGLDRAAIPVSMGGDYFYHQQFHGWVRGRLTMEGAMNGAPPIRNSSTANFVTTMAIQEFVAGASSSATVDANTGKDKVLVVRQKGETRKDFETRRNKVYNQRCYSKRRNQQQELASKRDVLHQVNQRLRQDNVRLEGLLLKAQQLILQAMQCGGLIQATIPYGMIQVVPFGVAQGAALGMNQLH